MASGTLDPAAFERLWEATRVAYNAAIDTDDPDAVLDLIDTWIECWRGVETIPQAQRVLQLALPGTVWARDEIEAMAYADSLADLASRCESPDSVGIVRMLTEAYSNVAEATSTPELTRQAADAAGCFAARLLIPDEVVDAELARALRNLAVDVDELASRLELATWLRELSGRQLEPVCSIDEHLSVALVCLSRSLGRGSDQHLALVHELAALHHRWPLSLRIAGDYVGETWNAYVCGGLDEPPVELLERFETIRAHLPQVNENIERALSYLRGELE